MIPYNSIVRIYYPFFSTYKLLWVQKKCTKISVTQYDFITIYLYEYLYYIGTWFIIKTRMKKKLTKITGVVKNVS